MGSNDKKIFKSLQSGDKKALKTTYDKYWKKMYIYAYKFLKNHEASEDIVQDLFVNLWEKSSSLEIDNLEAYLFKSLKYRLINYVRDQKTTVKYNEVLKNAIVTDPFESNMDYLSLKSDIIYKMEKLPKRCRKVFYLSRIENYNNIEIASELNISIRTVETHISNALNFFRFHFNKPFN